MDRKIQIGSPKPKPPEVPSSTPTPPPEVWEAPFERWMRMADDLLRELPLQPIADVHEHRI